MLKSDHNIGRRPDGMLFFQRTFWDVETRKRVRIRDSLGTQDLSLARRARDMLFNFCRSTCTKRDYELRRTLWYQHQNYTACGFLADVNAPSQNFRAPYLSPPTVQTHSQQGPISKGSSNDSPEATDSAYLDKMLSRYVADRVDKGSAANDLLSCAKVIRAFFKFAKSDNVHTTPEQTRSFYDALKPCKKFVWLKNATFMQAAAKADERLGEKAIQNYMSYLKSFFSYLLGYKSILSDPLSWYEMTNVVTKNPRPYLPPETVEIIRKLPCPEVFDEDEWRFAIFFGSRCGARRGETMRLFCEDFDFLSPIPSVLIKTLKQGRSIATAPKRKIPIPPSCLDLARRLVKAAGTGSIFLTLISESEWEREKPGTLFSRHFSLGAQAIDERADYHCFRHYVSSEMVNAGVLGGMVSEIVGHKTVKGVDQASPTTRIYTHYRPEVLLEAMNKVR